MTTLPTSEQLAEGLEALIAEAETLAADYAEVVQDAIRAAREEPLDEVDAWNLFVRILTILRTTGRQLDVEESAAIAEQIRSEAAALVAARNKPTRIGNVWPDEIAVIGGLVFHSRNGLKPRPVIPVPTFNGQAIPLTEGYVDVTTLPLWRDNHRVVLHVSEFRELNNREPDADELLGIMHGKLPGLGSNGDKDPFKLNELAASIARKGVERPPICAWGGEPKDGNRRIAAARMVLESAEFTPEQKDRARWIRVWQAPEGTTEDQFEAIVVALNFEPDHKQEWPEYVKARLVFERYRTLKEDTRGRFGEKESLELRKRVAEQFAIKHSEVKRYLEMVRWAEDFEDYHTAERGLDAAAVRYKSNDIFQWFYEVQAGRGQDKLVEKIQQDDALRAVVYDLMYDVLDSGLQVRNLHKVVADEAALDLLKRAHDERRSQERALKFVDAAVAEAQKNSPTKRLGFEQFLRNAVDRLGSTPPNQWRSVDTDLLRDLDRVFHSALGAIEGELTVRSGGSIS